ncbi:tyrosine-type recombinase/integrase [Halomonas salinarum]|uniref:tyrosine-type recombinase/integrase n=1 Tax=Halomonas salinarum TaxID=1158993 RepID=UPI003CC9149F
MTEEHWPPQAQQPPVTYESRAATLADSVRISATSDVEAVSAWLEEYQDSAQTFRAYRKEAERLLLWLDSQGLTLATLRRDGLDAFEAFLSDPRPATRWIGPPRPRQADDWRPFRRPLSASSRRQSLVILQGLYSWLVEAGWVDHNPFRLMRGKRRRLDNRQESIERYLERPLWDWFWAWLNRPPLSTATARQQFDWQRRRLIFGFAYLLAPRISEMAAARMGDFYLREGRWWWRVIGKGDKLATIPVPPDMMSMLGDWREHLGLARHPEPDDESPLLRGLNGQRSLGDNQLYRLIKKAFDAAAFELETAGACKPGQAGQAGQAGEEGNTGGDDDTGNGNAALARTLRAATPHWLRHTAITHQAQGGVELRYLARSARHSRLDTTARYLHAEAEEWQKQMSGHGLK